MSAEEHLPDSQLDADQILPDATSSELNLPAAGQALNNNGLPPAPDQNPAASTPTTLPGGFEVILTQKAKEKAALSMAVKHAKDKLAHAEKQVTDFIFPGHATAQERLAAEKINDEDALTRYYSSLWDLQGKAEKIRSLQTSLEAFDAKVGQFLTDLNEESPYPTDLNDDRINAEIERVYRQKTEHFFTIFFAKWRKDLETMTAKKARLEAKKAQEAPDELTKIKRDIKVELKKELKKELGSSSKGRPKNVKRGEWKPKPKGKRGPSGKKKRN